MTSTAYMADWDRVALIAGAPGSGKTGAAVLLILAILTYREQMPDGDPARVPIPVMFTLHGWDPQTQPVHDWLALKLQQAYEQFTGRDGVSGQLSCSQPAKSQ